MKKILIPLMAATLLSACSEYEHRGPPVDRAAMYDSDINKIAIYDDLNRPRRGLTYQEFTEISGLEKMLPKSLDSSGVWVNTVDELSTPSQEYSAVDGRVYIKIPTSMAPTVLGRLQAYRNKVLGIKPDTSKEHDGFP